MRPRASSLGAGSRLEHPLVDASGTFDLLEYARRYDGDYFADFPFAAYVPKTVTADARTGNPPPRVTETPAGMINAIGLENPGIDAWIDRLPEWAPLRQPVIVSVGGNAPAQYAAVVAAPRGAPRRRAAPARRRASRATSSTSPAPTSRSGLQIGADPAATAEVVAACREATGRLPARQAHAQRPRRHRGRRRRARRRRRRPVARQHLQGAWCWTAQTLRPFLGNRTGGLCGPAIKPIALRMVAEVAQAFPDTPVVGMGGVMTGLDALEFIACGATAVAVGAANFTAFEAPQRILAELRDELAGARLRVRRRGARRGAPRLTRASSPRPRKRPASDALSAEVC